MKVAIIHDWFLQYGGAERVVEVLREIWPDAPVYTAFDKISGGLPPSFWGAERLQNPDSGQALRLRSSRLRSRSSTGRARMTEGCETLDIRASFLQRVPLISRFPRLYTPLYPLIFESFDFSNFDVVISSDAFFAKRIITKPGTAHVCLSEVVPHFLWRYLDLGKKSWFQSLLFAPLMNYLRVGDYIAAQRVDYFVANSKTTAERIKKFYRRDAEVIYLPVDVKAFEVRDCPPRNTSEVRSADTSEVGESAGGDAGGYFMTVSRLTKDKRIDLAITVCTQLGLPLKVVGDGEEKKRLKKLAGPTVEFLGWKSHQEQAELYRNCKALIFPGEEDFGIVPVEAMAAGVPVIAFGRGGATETVIAGRTGEFFSPQTSEALAETLKNFDSSKYDPKACQKRAEKFGKDVFKAKFKRFVEKCFLSSRHSEDPERPRALGGVEGDVGIYRNRVFV